MIPEVDKIKTGQNIKRLLQNKHITPSDLMKYLHLSCVQTIYRWFEGVNVPSIDNLYALSCLLGVGIDELVVGMPEDKEVLCRRMMIRRMWRYSDEIKRLTVTSEKVF